MDCEKVRKHFNAASKSEWERLDADEYHRLIYRLHLDFIKTEPSSSLRILDAWCGSGRYAVEFARRGGTAAFSVNCTWGILRNALGKMKEDFFANGDFWRIDEVIETGDCPSFESVRFGGESADRGVGAEVLPR